MRIIFFFLLFVIPLNLYSADKQYVIDKTSGELKRYGFCDFANDGSFDSVAEKIIVGDYSSLDIINEVYTWDGVKFNYNASLTDMKNDNLYKAEIISLSIKAKEAKSLGFTDMENKYKEEIARLIKKINETSKNLIF